MSDHRGYSPVMLESTSCWEKTKRALRYITVEPTMVLYMMAFMLTSVIEEAFFIYKACSVNHQLNDTICNNISADENKQYNTEVQVTVSHFHQWNNITGHAIPIILALFMGAWSDRRGRKIPLLIGLIGKFIYSAMIVVNTTQKHWPVEYIVYTATLPMSFTGADVAIFAAVFAYISDITSLENRTFRVTIVEVCYLATMPTGIALGRYLFSNVTDRSYTIMFSINASLLLLAILYTAVFLDTRTSERQRPLSEAPNLLADYFDHDHVVQTFRTLFKRRPSKRRTYLLLLVLGMALYTFQREEKSQGYLYLQLALRWTFDQISYFRTYQSAMQDVVLLVAIPVMSRWLRWRDTVIIMVGAVCHSAARFFFAYAQVGWVVYLGGVFGAFGPIAAPVIRSMTSKIVAVSERGKAFSVLAVADNAIPLVSATCYAQIYIRTLHYFPAAIFYLTIATQMCLFAIAMFIGCTATEEELVNQNEEVTTSCLENKS